jgi:trimeric autotransporter adhesin
MSMVIGNKSPPPGRCWKSFGTIAFLGAVAAAQVPPDLRGTWQMTADSLTPYLKFSATVTMAQSESNLSGQFVYGGNAFATFSGEWETLFGSGVNLSVSFTSGEEANFQGGVSANAASLSGESSDRNGDVGVWNAYLLSGPPSVASVSNSASGLLGPIAPGEIISIYANPSNPIGPATGVGLQLDQSGKVATSLGGVQVLFLPAKVYAPLTYVGAGQINAVVPCEIAGVANPQIQVLYLGQSSAGFALQTASGMPGLFTLNGTGKGAGAILNDDGITVNGSTAPEPRGGVIVLFVTGEGQTVPAGISGEVTTLGLVPPLTPTPVLPVTALINGQPAPVIFSGEAPGLVSGVLQINVQIPITLPSGTLPIQVVVGGASTQDGVTVALQ